MSKGSSRCGGAVLVVALLAGGTWGSPSSKQAALSAPIQVSNECIRGAGKLLVHVALPMKYKPPYEIISGRYLYQLVCLFETHKCHVIEVKLGGVDQGGKLGPWDLNQYLQVELAAPTGTTYVIKGPELKTFTVDLDKGTVSLLESRYSVKDVGKGFAGCQVQDFQQCTHDAECVKGHRCSNEEGKCRKRVL